MQSLRILLRLPLRILFRTVTPARFFFLVPLVYSPLLLLPIGDVSILHNFVFILFACFSLRTLSLRFRLQRANRHTQRTRATYKVLLREASGEK